MKTPIRLILTTSLIGVAACAESPVKTSGVQPTPQPGATSFYSADGHPGQQSLMAGERNAGQAPTDDLSAEGEARTVEEGDIYRVGPNGTILNLNAFRGLQIIDFANPASPTIIGRVAVSGSPVEMYQVGDRVFMLINNWYGYYGNRESIRAQSYHGGLVLVADISDPRAPRITGRAEVPGHISSSRLTRGNGREALFVAASDGERSYVKSFSVSSAGALTAKTQLELGGWVTAIQASPSHLMVASHEWSAGNVGSTVALIDISNPEGTMRLGSSVSVRGHVQNKHNMNIDGDVLRIVSGNNWSSSTNTNHVETFEISNIEQIRPIENATFGAGQSLFATLFLGEKAFFVTYERVDPFHAFEITTAGRIIERAEFVVSGWNDYFRPVDGEQRLVGIGKNDENRTNTLAVSLYDITNLSNPRPLLDRAEIDLDWSWSEANWDDRAFSVLENATNVEGPRGIVETGLVLLPFSGWDQDLQRGASGVQIFTFSDRTISRRGVMVHDTPVRRTFMADRDEDLVGNLSEVELSFFDTRNPDRPEELGRVELAPNYSGFLVFGNHGVRRSDDAGYWGWWGGQTNRDAHDRLEVISLETNVDIAAPITTIEIPAGARVLKLSRDRVAVVSSVYGPAPENGGKQPVTTTVEVISFADPTRPARLGSVTSDELPGSYPYYGGYYGLASDAACFDCGWYGWGSVVAAGDALAFLNPVSASRLEGMQRVVSRWPADDYQRWDRCWDSTGPKACTYVTGNSSCVQLTRVDGTVEPEICSGEFYQCTQDATGSTDCVEIAESSIRTQGHTSTHEKTRYWTHYDVHVVDVAGTGAPSLGPVVAMAENEEAVGSLVSGNDLYLTHKQPFRVEGDARPYVRYFFRKIGLANPQRPSIAGDVNIPGQLVNVEGDRLVTRDHLWGRRVVETTVNRLTLAGGSARLDGSRRFDDRLVHNILLDGRGHALVSHGPTWSRNTPSRAEQVVRLAALDLVGTGFRQLSEVDIDEWASLRTAENGRAIFGVPGGMLVVNLDRIQQPFAQAYFPVYGWASNITTNGDDVYMSAGRFGIHTLDTDTFNLFER